jgi:hypothetical protein
MYLCKFFFTSIKSDDFQLCFVISKKEEKNSGFIAATLYKKTEKKRQLANGRGDGVGAKTIRPQESLFL